MTTKERTEFQNTNGPSKATQRRRVKENTIIAICKAFEISPSSIREDSLLKDLLGLEVFNYDDLLLFAIALEEKHSIEISDFEAEGLMMYASLGELVDWIMDRKDNPVKVIRGESVPLGKT